MIRQICSATAEFGVESRILTLSPNPVPPVLRRDEAEVFRYPLHLEIASSGFSAKAISGFRDLVHWADVVNYHFPWPFADLLHLFGGRSKPSIVTYHSDIVRQKGLLRLYRPLMLRFLGRADRIVATSPNYLGSSDVLQRFADKVTVIPIGLDESLYPSANADRVSELRQELGDDFFLFVGVLRYYKGLHFLIDALKGTDLQAVIAGTGPEERGLIRRAAGLDRNTVRFLGAITDEDKVALMSLCRGVVFPSFLRSEAFGVTLLEGAMSSKPLISTEIGTGTSFVNIHEETGFVVAPADPSALREAMSMLQARPGLAGRMGERARQRFDRLFTGSRMGESYAALYTELA